VAQFTVAGLVVTLALAALTGVLARRAGAQQAMRSFESLARVTAASLSPSLDAAPSADPKTRLLLRRQVQALRASGPIVRVKVWDPSGRVLWSDQPGLVGRVFDLGPSARRALQTGSVGSAVADPREPENAYQRGMGTLLEAYVGVQDRHGARLLVDVFERWDDAATAARQTWLRFTPAALGALILLELVQVPLAWRLARRLRRAREAEAALMQATVQASEAERRRIAGEVHDHVIQDLTGLVLDLDAARRRGAAHGAEDDQLIAGAASRLRSSIADLRTLLTSLLPARLPHDNLPAALLDLGSRLESGGTRVQVENGCAEELDRPVAALLYRCAQEALRNVAAHSRATVVDVSVRCQGERVTMIIDDDGCGFDDSRLSERDASGHLGLRALGHLVSDAGGSLTASSAPGQGTRLVVAVPRRAAQRERVRP
jgi:two-component system, NarL family, sensor kinase